MLKILVAILLITLYVAVCLWYRNFLTGIWVADSSFCESTGANNIMITVGPPKSVFSNERSVVFVYVVGENVSTHMATVDICGQNCVKIWSKNNGKESTWDLKWDNNEGDDSSIATNVPFDEGMMRAYVDVNAGELRLFSGSDLCVLAYKANDLAALSPIDD